MSISEYYPVLSTINFIAALFGVYYGRKLYASTKGATDFWLFLSAFIASLGAYTLFAFVRKALLMSYDAPMRSAQDLAVAFAAVFALMAAVYAKKMFDRLLG
ncbi:hypothetical protein ANME2D_00135 [Candidatus Methanoperedens nitroreducens]|uniref:Uncharacterized protein n=1 Tax=Candidatus Methanoperedens nitratireducens TaxID=1392998 RepID=A0A062V1V4_9EURY|nr:hypothetical protein [Candidatus Methanoperedens nitroreducens]KCZ73076.1 hypothetical protein ANME2D_00135 [Candidatus Methanoperedens nitroreducens]MDJ1422978.1 hypothetical protein [Candidatus Methanoperedens sp.]